MADLTWRNETRKLSDLVPWEHNPKRMTKKQAEGLRASIEHFGFAVPFLVSPDGDIYDGHQRQTLMTAIKDYGPNATVDVRVSSRPLTDDERRELVIRLKQNQAGWDFDLLPNLYEKEELIEWGFEPEELGMFPDDDKPEDPGPQIDKAEELREKWGVETGQLWQLGEHRLICGDCTDAAVVARVMGGEKAQMVATSPPYAVGKEYETDVSFAEHLILLRDVADRCVEAVIPGGFIFINFGEIAAQSHAGPLTGSDRQCIYPISKDYWQIFHDELRCDLYAQRIWYKPFNRLQQPFWSYKTSIPHYQEWEHIWTWRTPGGNGDRRTDWDISVHAIWDTRNEATDDKPLTRHVAAFPVCLPERAIKAHSLTGELVMEPFLGSGTTLIACERLGRRCRAIEISPAYCAVAIERWAVMTGIEPVLLEPAVTGV